MPFLNFGGNRNKYCNLSDMNLFIKSMKTIKKVTRIRIHFGPGSTFSKCRSEDPNRIHFSKYRSEDPKPDPLLLKGGSEDPDRLCPNVDPRIRIRIHVKM